MTTGSRLPTWKERENNRRRERRRRAIAAKIYAGLRKFGNYTLPKHCDNNEVLKALCNQAGWIVEQDGTIYRKGCKPTDRMHIFGGSTSASPSSSYNPSPCASYNPSPGPSSIPSPVSSHYMTNNGDANSLIPWLKNLSSGSLSAPVTPPLSSSPAAQTSRIWNDPSRQILPDHHGWLNGVRVPQPGPTSPTFNLVSRNSLGFVEVVSNGGGSRMWTPVQSWTCSPFVADGPMSDCVADEFAFGGSSSINGRGLVKAWEGERIHEECGSDDLELTLGTSRTR